FGLGAEVRQRDGESGALAGLTLHRDVAPEQLAEMPGDRQAEASAAVFLRGRGVRLAERLEQTAELLLVHADTSVRDCDPHHGPIGLKALRDHSQPAVLHELAAVAEYVEHALLQLAAVGSDAAEVIGEAKLEDVAVLLNEGSDDHLHLLEQRGEIDV